MLVLPEAVDFPIRTACPKSTGIYIILRSILLYRALSAAPFKRTLSILANTPYPAPNSILTRGVRKAESAVERSAGEFKLGGRPRVECMAVSAIPKICQLPKIFRKCQ